MFISIESSLMRQILCVFDTRAGPNLIQADVLDRSWLDSIRQRNMPDICSVSDIQLEVSGTIAFHLRMGKSRTPVNFRNVNVLVVLDLLRTTYTDSIIKSIHAAERKIVCATPRRYQY